MDSNKQKQLVKALFALNEALAKKANCTQLELVALKVVLGEVEKRMNANFEKKVNHLEQVIARQNTEIVELRQALKSFEKLFRKHAQRVEKEQLRAFDILEQKQRKQFEELDEVIEQKFNEVDAKVINDIDHVRRKVEKNSDMALNTFKSLMETVANNNEQEQKTPRSFFAAGLASGSVIALCLTIWLSLGAAPQTGVTPSQEIASLFDINRAQVAAHIDPDARTGLSVFESRTAFNFIRSGLSERIDAESIPVIPRVFVEDSFALSPVSRFHAGDYAYSFEGDKSFIEQLREEAEKGNPWAQHDLALALYSGQNVERNIEEASKWFKEAAMKGVANAQHNLAVLYHKNVSSQKDLEKAVFWYEQAAAQNHPQSTYNLAVAYGDGIGVEIDHSKAMGLFKKSYEAGITESAFYIATLAEAGVLNNNQPDVLQAQLWYERAAEAGNTRAVAALDRMVAENKIPSSMSASSMRALSAIETAAE